MIRAVLNRRQMYSITTEVTKTNSPEYLENIGRSAELTKI